MPAAKTDSKSKRTKSKTQSKPKTGSGARLDVVVDGPMLFVPEIEAGKVLDLDVYSPTNGHPVGAVFLPATWFTDEELSDPHCEKWPEPEDFLLLDPHSYAMHLTQTGKSSKGKKGFLVTDIPESNHKVRPGRKISSHWDIAMGIKGRISDWTSPRVADVTEGLFYGSDAPTTPTVALMQRLTYTGVTEAEFSGAPKDAKEYLKANLGKGGTLLIVGEIYYQSSLQHERRAIEALAKLAGLDLHLISMNQTPGRTRLMGHTLPCYSSIVVA